MDINFGHRLFGHISERALKTTMEHHGFKPTGNLHFYEACAIAKAKSKAISKETHNFSSKPGERIYLDLEGPFPQTAGGLRYHLGIIDNYSRINWNYFIPSKDAIGKPF